MSENGQRNCQNRSGEQRPEDLLRVLEISRALVAANDLDRLLQLIVELSCDLLGAERATVFLYDKPANELVSRVATGLEELRIPADTGIAGATIREGQTINVKDAYTDERFSPSADRKTGFRTRNILSVPLRDYQGGLVGVLQILNKKSGPFSDYCVTLAETLAAQAGVAIQRERLIEHFVQKQEMERAMKIARDIQQDLLPDAPPNLDGFDVAGFTWPADLTGGDIFDFLGLAPGRCAMIVADATGHGIGPAMVVAETRAMLRAVALRGTDISTNLSTVNNLLTADLSDAMFVTCFLGVLDAEQKELQYASAGHGPMMFYHRAEDTFDVTVATDMPLGILAETPYSETVRWTFQPGDLAIILTDGFLEATNRDNEMYGLERAQQLIREHRDSASAEIIRQLHRAVLGFSAGREQADDLTAVIIRKN